MTTRSSSLVAPLSAIDANEAILSAVSAAAGREGLLFYDSAARSRDIPRPWIEALRGRPADTCYTWRYEIRCRQRWNVWCLRSEERRRNESLTTTKMMRFSRVDPVHIGTIGISRLHSIDTSRRQVALHSGTVVTCWRPIPTEFAGYDCRRFRCEGQRQNDVCHPKEESAVR